jgi:DNA gyrase subunit B
MRELIERGYIYIAQPPLYKVKKGKQEHYVKDDNELNQYLLQMALDKAQLQTDVDIPVIQGTGLEKLAQEFACVSTIIKHLTPRYDGLFLDYLTYMSVVDEALLSNHVEFSRWCKALEEKLNNDGDAPAVFKIQLTYQTADDYDLTVNKRLHGIDKTLVIKPSFFNSHDYKRIAQYANDTMGLFTENSLMKMGEREQAVNNFKQAYEWMMKEVKKGQHIQRYKGLGEMNPDQLWETTLDASSRRLLQVTIEDGIAADEIFTTLMGDEVEPRRDFIVKNALDVSNLDV